MTLKKYWVRQGYWVDDEFLETGNPAYRECFYLAADVDQVVEELQNRSDDYDLTLGLICGYLDKFGVDVEPLQTAPQIRKAVHDKLAQLQSDLARVTEELEQIKGAKK